MDDRVKQAMNEAKALNRGPRSVWSKAATRLLAFVMVVSLVAGAMLLVGWLTVWSLAAIGVGVPVNLNSGAGMGILIILVIVLGIIIME